MGSIIILIVMMKKLRLREVQSLPQDCTTEMGGARMLIWVL